MRDHDVRNESMRALVALAHTVFNAGLGETWETNLAEPRYFESAAVWIERLADAGFDDSGQHLLQDHDPTDNTLFCFARRSDVGPTSLSDPVTVNLGEAS